MFATPRQRVTSIMVAIALLTGTTACGGDDETSSAEAASAEDATGTGASVTSESSEPNTTSADQRGDPCAPVGTLVPGDHGLNDRCQEPAAGWAATFVAEELAWGQSAKCADLLAVPNELLVAIGPSFEGTMDEALDDVVTELDALNIVATAPAPFSDQAGIVELSNADLAQVQTALPSLQRAGRSVDLNYLEPVQPNNGFRPADDPKEPSSLAASDEQQLDDFGGADLKKVAVIDSPDESAGFVYDVDGNGLVDEDNGHGLFVKSIIDRAGADVTLVPVLPYRPGASTNPSVLTSGRWSPMMFSDEQIIRALELVPAGTQVVNMSLGGVGCPMDELGGGRLTLARVMDNMYQQNKSLTFIAAAGNNGDDVLHFPAAWRHPDVVSFFTSQIPASSLIDAPDPRAPGEMLFSSEEAMDAAAEIESLHEGLMSVLYAVGSVEADGTRSDFSNCGVEWVNAAAFGSDRLGLYPSSGALQNAAAWSGTSFATANFTAAFIAGAFNSPPSGVATAALTATGAQELPNGLAC